MMFVPRSSADSLRLALLVALGLPTAVACGGSLDNGGGNTGGTSSGGSGTGGDVVGTGGATTGGSGSGGTLGYTPCTNPKELLIGEVNSGFVVCDEGYTHRPRVNACPSKLPRPDVLPPTNTGTGGTGTLDVCSTDTDCPGPHGYCALSGGSFFEGPAFNQCFTGCVNDADCGAGLLCDCGDSIGKCVAASCKSDAECDENFLCVGTTNSNGCGNTRYYGCHRAADECLVNADCASGFCENYLENRSCGSGVVCGRPFLVEFAKRQAGAVSRSDWTAPSDLRFDAIPEELRRALAEHWTELGLMEHASIAAFARFSLQLLALGAPASLLEETNAALVDETRHARLCFELASRYRGSDVGPGPLEMTGALETISLRETVLTTVLEGCIGETQAALEASRAAGSCEDPRVAAILRAIAEDESRHAALAYRFVRWALEKEPALEGVVRSTFENHKNALLLARRTNEGPKNDLRTHGVLSAEERNAVSLEAYEKVIAPCAAAVLAERRRPDADIINRSQQRQSAS